MADRVKQTFGWVYKFNPEAANEFRSTLKHPDDAFITYDTKSQFWTVDCDFQDAPAVLGDFIPKFRRYHSQEYRQGSDKIKFVGDIPMDNILSMIDDESVTKDSGDGATVDAASTSIGLKVKAWRPAKGREYLVLFTPDLLASLGKMTSTTIAHNDDINALEVKGEDQDHVCAAYDRLNNLQNCLALFDNPLSTHVVIVHGPEDPNTTRVMSQPLEALKPKILAMILPNYHEEGAIDTLPSMLVNYAARYDVDTQALQLPQAIQHPRKATELAFGDFGPWFGFEYTPFGDQSKLPEMEETLTADGEYVEMIRDRHPDMPLVERWRHGAAQPVDAFAPDEQPITYEPPAIEKPRVGVAPPPSLAGTAMRGKYAVRKAELSDDRDSDSEAEDGQGSPAKATTQLPEVPNDAPSKDLPSGVDNAGAVIGSEQKVVVNKPGAKQANAVAVGPFSNPYPEFLGDGDIIDSDNEAGPSGVPHGNWGYTAPHTPPRTPQVEVDELTEGPVDLPEPAGDDGAPDDNGVVQQDGPAENGAPKAADSANGDETIQRELTSVTHVHRSNNPRNGEEASQPQQTAISDPYAGLLALEQRFGNMNVNALSSPASTTSDLAHAPQRASTQNQELRTQAQMQQNKPQPLVDLAAPATEPQSSAAVTSNQFPTPGEVLTPRRASTVAASITTSRGGRVVTDEEREYLANNRQFFRIRTSRPALPPSQVDQAQLIRAVTERTSNAPSVASGERLQADDEVTSREYHRTMGQQKPNPKGAAQGQHEPNAKGLGQNQPSKMEKKVQQEKRQAAIKESWGEVPQVATANLSKQGAGVAGPNGFRTDPKVAAGKRIASTDGIHDSSASRTTEESMDSRQQAGKVSSTIHSILSGARAFTGQLSLQVAIGKHLVQAESVSREQLNSVMSVKKWRKFLNPPNAVKPPETTFLEKVTTSGADCNFIVDLRLMDGSRMFEDHAYGYEVVYEFLCRTTSDEEVVLTMYEVGGETDVEGIATPARASYTFDRLSRPLGFVNYHFGSHMWDARLAVKATPDYEATTAQKEAAQAFVDSIIVPKGCKTVKLFARVPTRELKIEEISMRRWTRFAYNSPNDKATTAGSSVSGDGSAVPSFYLQVTEVQLLHWMKRGDDLSQIHAYAESNEVMVKEERLSYQVSIGSSAADWLFLENTALPLGGVSEWTEGEIIDAGLADSLVAVAKEIVPRIDGVGFHNRGPHVGNHGGMVGGSVPTSAIQPPRTVGGANVRAGTFW